MIDNHFLICKKNETYIGYCLNEELEKLIHNFLLRGYKVTKVWLFLPHMFVGRICLFVYYV